MAVTATSKGSVMVLRVENGLTPSGATAYANRTISNINEEITDENFLAVANGFAGLIQNTLNTVARKDIKELAEG